MHIKPSARSDLQSWIYRWYIALGSKTLVQIYYLGMDEALREIMP